MKYYFTSDIHFGHANIIKYAKRPFQNIDEMNETIIQNWNAHVTKDDVVYHLGDLAFLPYDKLEWILSRLNGREIHLIHGNHDNVVINNRRLLLERKIINSMEYYRKIKINTQDVILFHYGCRVWDKCHHGSWQLYGHSHNSLPPYGKSVDVGVDSTAITGKAEYRPFSFDEIKVFMDKQEIKIADRHGDKSNA